MVETSVTRFHQLPAIAGTKSFAFLPSKEQTGSLEYASYCEKVSASLKAYGWTYVEKPSDAADYLIYLEYAVDNGETISGVIPIFGQTGGGTTHSSGTVRTNYGTSASYSGTTTAPMTFGQTGSVPYSRKEYSRQFILTVIDRAKSSDESIVKVFEGRVRSSGSTGEISAIMPALIEAMFKNFPGMNGKTSKISIPFKN
jgi:hypothetical protein